MQKRERSSIKYDTSIAEEVKSFTPIGCFFLDTDDPLKLRLAHALSSVLYSLYGAIPHALSVVHEITGAPPAKLDPEDPADVSQMMFVKRFAKIACSSCSEVGCPWVSALASLRVS